MEKKQCRDYDKAQWENSMWAPGIWNKAMPCVAELTHFLRNTLDILLGPGRDRMLDFGANTK